MKRVETEVEKVETGTHVEIIAADFFGEHGIVVTVEKGAVSDWLYEVEFSSGLKCWFDQDEIEVRD